MRRTHEDAEKTRQTILDASIQVFIKKGYTHTTMDDISNAANVTRGAVYWHFKNKEDILIELADSIYKETSQKAAFFFSQKTSLHEKISNTLKNLCYWYLEDEQARQKRIMLIATFANRDHTLMDKIFFSLYPEEKSIPDNSQIIKFVMGKTWKRFQLDSIAGKAAEAECSEAFLIINSFIEGLISVIVRIPEVMTRKSIDNIIDKFMEGFFHTYKHILEAK